MSWRLATYELATGKVETLLVSDDLIEAPNWLPDGSGLLVNGDGRLYRVPFEDPALVLVDTGFAMRINNDHGVSPDGSRIVISDASAEGASCIYTLPLGGGAPVSVTPKTPSWWHGWSPDGATLAYTARRGGVFDIYSIPADGGEERRLTEGFEHADGPDYTPEGAWIWFNGQRAGAMDLWRMRPDGSDLQRMTADNAVNWFPHPSPVGAHVLYLAYAPGVEGHPRDHDVELRLMPAEGGPFRKLLALFGGQGTINVPCWAPDASRFAFVEALRPV